MPELPVEPVLEDLISHLHRRERLRVWSIIITIFGDAVLPRGGEVWLGSLLEICERLQIEAGSVRAAMSRLAQDGWVSRERSGRKSFYRLAEAGRAEFERASIRIYAPLDRKWEGSWTILIVSEAAGEGRDARRRQLKACGFGAVAPTVFIRPEVSEGLPVPTLEQGDFIFTSRLEAPSNAEALGVVAWSLDELEEDYSRFMDVYGPLHETLKAGEQLTPLSAMAARTLLIHDFRRLVLRDPMLPADVIGDKWIGDEARRLVANCYSALAVSSDEWLSTVAEGPNGTLANASDRAGNRFRVLES
ncbi:phenylacetic acid degradation operon negative regulatory protein PaaX [Pseudovibrio sp. SPO723]|uniref:phenylacetic acid degradation operon negative regulatory protein PaaX n=1 Tax=Nesiotobacter zosterae TaxID=392721 RepID=UPI0029C470FA|nr:phenylacetic acid degradation operon negative regulatory protein PaaX [Pseudovibrio sp. SPO723]MDX5593542.1 phenylacetic acid degradation operon negative regulatory protein PaaX [Pseudovibrio sp. SPO723]